MKKAFLLGLFLIFWAGTRSVAQLPNWLPTANLAAWYPFDGDVNDYSGNGNNGIPTQITYVSNQAGVANSAASFNGIASFVKINPSPTLDINGSISISVWVRTSPSTGPSNYQQVFFRGDVQGGYDPYSLALSSGRYLYRRDFSNGATLDTLMWPISDGNWHHIVAIYDQAAAVYKIYVDAVLKRTKPSLVPTINYPTSTFGNSIGAVDDGTWQFFNGAMDELAVYARAISDCEIRQLYLRTNLGSASTQSAAICPGATYTFGGTVLNTAGTYVDTFQNAQGCDSIVTLNLAYNPTSQVFRNVQLCTGTPYNFEGTVLNTAGTYTKTFLNSKGCDSTITLNLSYNQSLQSTQNVSLCPGATYTFGGNTLSTAGTFLDTFQTSAGCDSIVTLNLSFINPSGDTLRLNTCNDSSFLFGTLLIDTSGTYIYRFTSTQGCDSPVVLIYKEYEKPRISFLTDPSEVARNVPFTFINASQNAIRYNWTFGDGAASTEANPTHQYQSAGRFVVCLTGWSPDGCSAMYCRDAVSEVQVNIEVPTAFSPNGDGKNDVLYARGVGVKSFSLAIYNRWGQKVFETNDMALGWDGSFNDQMQNNELFGYTLNASFINGENISKKGNITILR